MNSHNEWDPLEEVIVGDLTNATIPSGAGAAICGAPRIVSRAQPLFAGIRYPRAVLRKARRELEGFVSLLEGEGVTVRRPTPQPFFRGYATPQWSAHGYSCAAPRDALLVVGNEIIEAPMSWRSRYFESFAYRDLLREHFAAGARWTSAPKPQLREQLYNRDFGRNGDQTLAITETEPVFDAADFVRAGRDIFAIRSNTANAAGIEWLRRHLNRYHDSPSRETWYHGSSSRDAGDARLGEPRHQGEPLYRVHEIPIRNVHAMHMDHHFMPLAPGRALVNPQWVVMERMPGLLPDWELLPAPPSDDFGPSRLHLTDECRRWLNMNVLSLDEKRVIVEARQPSLIKSLRAWGFEPIPCEFRHYAPFGGAFHCATLDVRRRGELRSYV